MAAKTKANTKANTKPEQTRAEIERRFIDAALDRIQGNGVRDELAPAALADLGDRDNNHHLCLDPADPAVSVAFRPGI